MTIQFQGTSKFLFQDALGRTIPVWYDCPEQCTSQTPVLIVMHGIKRNAEEYRESWITHARAKHAFLLVPEFSREQFPSVDQYNYGDLFTSSGELNPKEQWSFTAIEKIFDVVKQSVLIAPTYHIYGHSAGAQFLHRFIFFIPETRIARAVVANSGFYTMPRDDVAFPYGLKNTPITRAELTQVFAKPVTILLGEADTDPNATNLSRTAEANAQGANRLERGKSFYATAQQVAAELATPFNWQIAFVPNVGHDNGGMAKSAIDWLFKRESTSNHSG